VLGKVKSMWRAVYFTLPRFMMAIITMAILFIAGSPAQAGCRWDGTAPSCSGSCNSNETEFLREGGLTSPFGSEGVPDFGKACILGGSKALCCERCPSGLVWREKDGNRYDVVCVTPEERDGLPESKPVTKLKIKSGCTIAGVPRPDIDDSDCLEAQTTGCVRRLLTDEQYANCLAANRRANGVIRQTGKRTQPKESGKATGISANTVYNEPSDDTSEANTACTMDAGDTAAVVSKGPQKWVRLSGISGQCGGGSGWVWNDGELQLP
jgi:hypothetical protein